LAVNDPLKLETGGMIESNMPFDSRAQPSSDSFLPFSASRLKRSQKFSLIVGRGDGPASINGERDIKLFINN